MKSKYAEWLSVFSDLDEDLGLAIATSSLPPEKTENIPEAPTLKLTESDYLEMKLLIKERQGSHAVSIFNERLHTRIAVVLTIIQGVVSTIQMLGNAARIAIDSVVLVISCNPIGLTTNLFTDFIQRVEDAGEAFKKPLYTLDELSVSLITGIGLALDNLPHLVETFKKDIDIAIFSPGKFADIQLYNIASVSILTEMQMVFDDIIKQLSGNRSRAIDGTIETSKSIVFNLEILRRDIEKGTL